MGVRRVGFPFSVERRQVLFGVCHCRVHFWLWYHIDSRPPLLSHVTIPHGTEPLNSVGWRKHDSEDLALEGHSHQRRQYSSEYSKWTCSFAFATWCCRKCRPQAGTGTCPDCVGREGQGSLHFLRRDFHDSNEGDWPGSSLPRMAEWVHRCVGYQLGFLVVALDLPESLALRNCLHHSRKE